MTCKGKGGLDMDIEMVFYEKIKGILSGWTEEGIYAISFYIYPNESHEYRGVINVCEFSVFYNTEREYAAAFPEDGEEARWNCACWKWLGETFLVDPKEGDEGTEQLFQWYREKGITDIGREETDCYDANGAYIGKGPVGEIELVTAAANIARRLQTEGFIREHFGENVPILIHDLEYSWFDLEATRFANPEGQAEAFLKFWEA